MYCRASLMMELGTVRAVALRTCSSAAAVFLRRPRFKREAFAATRTRFGSHHDDAERSCVAGPMLVAGSL